MTKFIIRLCYISFPILFLGILLEIFIRQIPNDFTLKKAYLDKNANNIEVLILGTSHAFYGINPDLMQLRSFNASEVSQSLDFDYEIYQKYAARMNKLKYIVIPIDYQSLFYRLETISEAWRIKNYIIYYQLQNISNFKYKSEILSINLSLNLEKVIEYLNGKSSIYCSKSGFGLGYNINNNRDLYSTAKWSILQDTKNDSLTYKKNVVTVDNLIKLANKYNVKVILYSSPVYFTYSDLMNRKQLSDTYKAINYLKLMNKNVTYSDLIKDTTFSRNDFHDADHLNVRGAEKLTRKINEVLQ